MVIMQLIKIELRNEYMSSNCYLIKNESEVVVIDPGFPDNNLFNYLESNNLKIDKIILTHGHYDHWTGLEELLNRYPNTKVYGSMLDEYWYLNNPFTNYIPKIDVDLNKLNEIEVFDTSFKIIKTPGHSRGSVSLLWDNYLISGDVLFFESVGRTDLDGGNFTELENSILKIYELDENIKILPGHGKNTTIKHEKVHNHFVKKQQ